MGNYNVGIGNPKYLHGFSKTKLYKRWNAMMTRCYNKNHNYYHRYGGLGIKVCKRWHNFLNFKKDMEPTFKINLSLERIDNKKDYSPVNCKWATTEEQNFNKSNTVYLSLNGNRMLLVEWAKKIKINPYTLRSRIIKGWSVEKALTIPLLRKRYSHKI